MNIAPGDAVLTEYGTGVVICLHDDNNHHHHGHCGVSLSSSSSSLWATLRLNRQPGKSIASGVLLTVNVAECITRKLVVATGMIVRGDHDKEIATTTTSAATKPSSISSSTTQEENYYGKKYLIEEYIPEKDVYMASIIVPLIDVEEGIDNDGNHHHHHHHSLAKSLAVMSSKSVLPKQIKEENDNGSDETSNNNFKHPEQQPQHKKHVIVELKTNQIDPSSTSAKFYPMLEDLMRRGEEAWSLSSSLSSSSLLAAAGTEKKTKEYLDTTNSDDDDDHDDDRGIIAEKLLSSCCTITVSNDNKGDYGDNNNVVAKVLSDTSKSSMDVINDKISSVVAATTASSTTTASVIAKTTTEGISLPEADEIRQVYDMLRDEDLTKLIQLGRERLRDLVDVDIPERTRKALGAMGIELDEGGEGLISSLSPEGGSAQQTIREKMSKLQKEALASMEEMLTIDVSKDGITVQANNGHKANIAFDNSTNIIDSILPSSSSSSSPPPSRQQVHRQAKEQFAKMFDHFSSVAASDPQLLSIFSSISEKSKLWQEMTGRIFQTKTVSLFMEGTQRLQARAAQLLNLAPGQIRGLSGGGGNGIGGGDLTRAFTEGDVAMTKLKSMEMGDAIRSRLFAAIELRSESSGGLDAIIAGSLTAISRTGNDYSANATSLLGMNGVENERMATLSGGVDEERIQTVINRLQSSATSAMKGTKETLIALLSEETIYRDAVLLHLEQVFLDLESQLGQELSAEEIAKLANGEGGTMSLFKPVAMKAAKDIELQLDAVEKKMKESNHWNSQADDALEKVRQITSGELSMSDILDMAAGFLDDDVVVSKSGGLIVKAESLLDDFEAASGRLKANAGGTDATACLMDAVTKAGITKETVMKGVEGLDVSKLLDDTQSVMTDERARREMISSAGDAALDFLLKILPSMPVPPFDGVREGLMYHLSNLSMAGFKVRKEDIHIEIAGIRAATTNDNDGNVDMSQPKAVKASELLIIDIKNISATLDDAVWSFEQTYMPYLKGSGKANTKLWNGAIRMKFELRRHIASESDDPVTGEKTIVWEPVLCLNDRFCSIGGIDLLIQGESRLAWAANKVASLLKNPLRDYVVSVIITTLKNNSGWLIDTLNQSLSPYWDFILRSADLELKILPKLARHHVTKADSIVEDEVELVWRERLPLGLNILTNDESGYLKVIDLPRGTQARKVAQDKKLDPDLFKGAMIVSVNGKRYGPDNQVDLFAALKDPTRPKSILFKLSSEDDAKRLNKHVERSKSNASNDKEESLNVTEGGKSLFTTVHIVNQGDIGIKFVSSPDNFALAVSGFVRDSDGRRLHHEIEMSCISENYLLCRVNGIPLLGEKGEGKRKALSVLEKSGNNRPLSLSFVKPYIHTIVLEREENYGSIVGGPSELSFSEVKSSSSSENKIILRDFVLTEGVAESNNVFIGDNLVFINGIPVGAGCRLLQGSGPPPTLFEVIDVMKQQSPLALTFARAQTNQTSTVKSYLTSSPLSLDIESAQTFSIAVSDFSQLGITFATGYNGTDVVVKNISGVEGPFQTKMKETALPLVGCKLEAVDGEVIPNYVTSKLVVNAMSRRWSANNRLELTFCDENHRDNVRKHKDSS